MKKIIAILLVCCLFVPSLMGQSYRTDFSSKDYVDTAATMIWLGPSMSGQLPMGDLHKTFKANLALGANFTVKTQKNWTFDLSFSYMFGANLRDATASFLGDMVREVGGEHIIIDGNGLESQLYFEGRYWFVGPSFGKVIPVNRWKNSGIWLRFGAGYFGHKIRINDYDNQVPQLLDDYKKLYDHRSAGFAMNQFIGYLFIQKNRLLNFYGGIEFYEIWSKPNRNYVFPEGPTANMKYKFSGLAGIKIGWNIPLYEKKSVTTFYYR